MSKKTEYRVVFFYDKRTQKESYQVIPGSYADANAFIAWARQQDYLDNVSEYFNIPAYQVGVRGKVIRISPAYHGLENRKVWENQSIYNR